MEIDKGCDETGRTTSQTEQRDCKAHRVLEVVRLLHVPGEPLYDETVGLCVVLEGVVDQVYREVLAHTHTNTHKIHIVILIAEKDALIGQILQH